MHCRKGGLEMRVVFWFIAGCLLGPYLPPGALFWILVGVAVGICLELKHKLF